MPTNRTPLIYQGRWMILVVPASPVRLAFSVALSSGTKQHPAILQGVVSGKLEFSERYTDKPEPLVERLQLQVGFPSRRARRCVGRRGYQWSNSASAGAAE